MSKPCLLRSNTPSNTVCSRRRPVRSWAAAAETWPLGASESGMSAAARHGVSRTTLLPACQDADVRLFGEGSACVWLWAWPELIMWSEPICWLFSPVVGNTRWPGDLWGVDRRGRLVIVEAKTWKRGASVDPFVDFLGPAAAVAQGTCDTIRTNALRERWRRLLRRERSFVKDHESSLRRGDVLDGCYPGVVPYSRHRAPVQRWRQLYLDRIGPEIASIDYENRVNVHLDAREQTGDPPPHMVGVVAALGDGEARLSSSGLRNALALRQMLGAERVRVVGVTSRRLGKNVEISASDLG